MFGLGAPELIIVLLIILLLFGAKKLPELARSLGQAGKEMRDGFENGEKSKTTSQAPKAEE